MSLIEAPRAQFHRSRATRSNFELWSWVFMRASGVLLVGLVIGHLVVNLVLGEGIKQVDFAFVAGKWASPFWQVYDLLMLWLAQLHGMNGLRTVINDYARRDGTRFWLSVLLYSSVILTVGLGTFVIFTFDPSLR